MQCMVFALVYRITKMCATVCELNPFAHPYLQPEDCAPCYLDRFIEPAAWGRWRNLPAANT